MNIKNNKVLGNKWFRIFGGIILYLILLCSVTRATGWLTILGTIALGVYLFFKSDKFKQRNKFIKSLTVIGLLFVTLIGGAFTTMTPESIQQNKLAADKAKIEKQMKKDEEQKAKEDKAKKEEQAKKDAEAKAIAEEESKKKEAEDEKSKALAKLNLKEVTISRVVDGDTLELSDGSKVRFIGVNTPESTTKQEPYGKEASDYTKGQLTGKTIYLEKDVSETDKYGRLLRYIWLDIPKEITDAEIRTKMYNANLLLNGYAEQSTYPPDVKYADYFKNYASEARNGNKGLWAINSNGTTKGDTDKAVSNGTSNNTASNPSSNNNTQSSTKTTLPSDSTPNSGEKQYVDANGNGLIKGNASSKIYHLPGGAYYDRTKAEAWFKTESEAQAAGYRRSSR